MVRIIDSVVNFFTPEVVSSFPDVWFKLFSSLRGEESFAEAIGMDLRDISQGVALEEILSEMDEAGVERALLHAIDLAYWGIRIPAEAVARAVEKYPDRFIAGAVGVNPYQGMASVQRLEAYVLDYGFRSAHFLPHWIGRPPNDAIYYPFYAKCVELDIAVCIQIRMAHQNFNRDLMRPEYIDEVAAYFPELRIVGLHAGWPWLEEYMALMLKHPNLYVTASNYPPKEWDNKFIGFVNGKGQDKVIFGSVAPTIKGGTNALVSGVGELGLSEEVERKYFRDNANRVFKLES
jgi:uncharacterized protein